MVTFRKDQDPVSQVDRSYLKTFESGYNQLGASNVDFIFETMLGIEGEGISFIGLGSAAPVASKGNHPGDSVYLRLNENEMDEHSVELLFQDANLSDNNLNVVETATLSASSTKYLARIEKHGSLISFSLDEDNDGSVDWTASTVVDIAADPNGSGADDFRFLQDLGNGHLFVGTGKEEREFDNFRVYLPGDMSGDGQITEADINPMVLALTNRTQYELDFSEIDVDLTGNINRSGRFDLGDLGPFKEMLDALAATSGNAVPEPSCLGMVFWAMLLRLSVVVRKRRR